MPMQPRHASNRRIAGFRALMRAAAASALRAATLLGLAAYAMTRATGTAEKPTDASRLGKLQEREFYRQLSGQRIELSSS